MGKEKIIKNEEDVLIYLQSVQWLDQTVNTKSTMYFLKDISYYLQLISSWSDPTPIEELNLVP